MTALKTQTMYLMDYCQQARWGVRGLGAHGWLQSQQISHTGTPNRVEPLPGNRWVMALSTREFWVLEPLQRGSWQQLHANSSAPGVWPLFCQHSHAWFVLMGEQKADAMAKVCGVDLRLEAFPVGQVAQTQVARTNAIVAHHGLPEADSVFSVFCDSAAADYMHEVLLDAIDEYHD